MWQIGVAVGLTPFILSGFILKLLFAGILTSKIVMQKSTLKISMIPQKSEWLASLEKLPCVARFVWKNLLRNLPQGYALV